MKKIAIAASLLLALPALAETNPQANPGRSSDSNMPKMTDAQLMAKIHKVNQEEISAGKLAQQKCKTDYCKQYGEMLVRDHENADRELMQIAKSAKANLDTPMPKVVEEREHTNHAKMEQLNKMTGEDFERGFGQMMQNGHAHVIAMLTNARDDVKNDQLKSFIDKTMSTLNAHETRAKALATGKSANQMEEKAKKAETSGNTDRGVSGRTPSIGMHKSDDRANSAGSDADQDRRNR